MVVQSCKQNVKKDFAQYARFFFEVGNVREKKLMKMIDFFLKSFHKRVIV